MDLDLELAKLQIKAFALQHPDFYKYITQIKALYIKRGKNLSLNQAYNEVKFKDTQKYIDSL